MSRTKKKKMPQKNIAKKSSPPNKKKNYHPIFGIVFLFMAVLFGISFGSYFYTWQVDQSTLNNNSEATNLIAKTGAKLGDFFIFKGLGISAFLVVYIFVRITYYCFTKTTFSKLIFAINWTILSSLWLATFLGFLSEPYLIFSGGIGIFINHFFTRYIGTVGLYVLLVFSLWLGVSIRFDKSPTLIFKWAYNFFLSLQAFFKRKNESENTATKTVKNTTTAPKPTIENSDDNTSKNTTVKTAGMDIIKPTEEEKVAENLSQQLVSDISKFDPTLELSNFTFPPLKLLREFDEAIAVDENELKRNKEQIVEALRNFKIEIKDISATVGPTVTLYEIVPEAGVKISKIKNLEDDIALSLAALGIRIIAPIPGKGKIGIEVPNKKPNIVSMRSVLASKKFQQTDMVLPIAFGKTITNETFVVDLAKMPHLLMAGATGQGKSVGLNTILTSILYRRHPSEVKFVLVDPKKVELTLFSKIERHYLAKLPDSEDAIITDTTKVVNTLNSLCIEMDDRYELLKLAMVRNIKEYNEKFKNRKLNPENGHRFLPYIVLVIDEFADLIMTSGKEVEMPIARLAQLARAIGIHLIVATQRPSVNVITGIIKANFPVRIAFRVTAKVDSRTILDSPGADQLIGRGDMLYSGGSDIVRLQCAFVDTPEVEEITDFIGSQQAYPDAYFLPEYIPEGAEGVGEITPDERDPLFKEAAEVIINAQQGSASLLQRKLKLGYNRAGRLIDQLEAAGIVGPFEGSKARSVLLPDIIALEELLEKEKK